MLGGMATNTPAADAGCAHLFSLQALDPALLQQEKDKAKAIVNPASLEGPRNGPFGNRSH